MRSIAIVCDVGNLFYCIKKKFGNRKLNYEKYLREVSQDNIVFRSFAYGLQLEDEAIGFITVLKHIGFEPKYKKPKVYEKDGERQVRRTSWNVGITTDIVRMIDKLDVVYIGSSDPELVPLVEWIKEKGVKCVIVSCGISRELKDVADSYIEIDESFLEAEPVTT